MKPSSRTGDELLALLVSAMDYPCTIGEEEMDDLRNSAKDYLYDNGWRLRCREWLPPSQATTNNILRRRKELESGLNMPCEKG